MSPLRPDMIGQSTWYEAFADGDGFTVNITVGQGDCQAGCIERHTWSYRVDATERWSSSVKTATTCRSSRPLAATDPRA